MTAPAKLDGMTATWVETTGIADHLAVTTIAEVAADTVVVAETAVAVAIVVDAVAMVAEAETAAVEAEIADGDARHAETRPSPQIIDRQSRETSYMLVSLGDWNHE